MCVIYALQFGSGEKTCNLLCCVCVPPMLVIQSLSIVCTGWKPLLQLGVVNCADSGNNDVCRQYNIAAYPAIMVCVCVHVCMCCLK